MPARSRSIRFPLICAAAYVGAVVGYLPLLTLLLPETVAHVAGEQRYAVLALVMAVGSIAAGAGNILFGWLSDRSRAAGGGRRRWIAAGLAAMLASYALLPFSRSPAALVAAIAAFQLALNAILAPLMALVAEEVPDRDTGFTTGLFAAGSPIAALLTLSFAMPSLSSGPVRLALVGGVATICLLPLLASRANRPVAPPPTPAVGIARRDLARAWLARLLIQVAGNVVFTDLLYLVTDARAGSAGGASAMIEAGTLLFVANVAPLPVAVALGRWSDAGQRRRRVLVALAAIAAAGLAVMAGAGDWPWRAAGFVAFAVGWGAFLALQVGYIMGLLPHPDHRGRDLGIVNLANTLPVLVGQALAALLAVPRHPGRLLATLAVVTLAAGLTNLAARQRR